MKTNGTALLKQTIIPSLAAAAVAMTFNTQAVAKGGGKPGGDDGGTGGVAETSTCMFVLETDELGSGLGIVGDGRDENGGAVAPGASSVYCDGGKVECHLGGLTPTYHFLSQAGGKATASSRTLKFPGFGGLVIPGLSGKPNQTFPNAASVAVSTAQCDGDYFFDFDQPPYDAPYLRDGNHDDLRDLPPGSGPHSTALRFVYYDSTSSKSFWRVEYGQVLSSFDLTANEQAQVSASDLDGDGISDCWLFEPKTGGAVSVVRIENWGIVAALTLTSDVPQFRILVVDQSLFGSVTH